MTLTIGWIRKKSNHTSELVIASDSRLRNRGAMDQSQKLFSISRGDCCLGFAGDTQIAYPLFMQVSSAFNNFLGTSSRATDITKVSDFIEKILNNLIDSWDLPQNDKEQELAGTQIMFAGWSWTYKKFYINVIQFKNGKFASKKHDTRLQHPWRENSRSLTVIGDYVADYKETLLKLLESRQGKHKKPKYFDFDYEPVEALQILLNNVDKNPNFPAIGGAPQLVKVYSHGNNLPFAVKNSKNKFFLFGRQLFDWERTEYPILDLTKKTPAIIYPKQYIPLPKDLKVVTKKKSGSKNAQLIEQFLNL